MSIKNGPITIKHIGEESYRFTSFPEEYRRNISYMYNGITLLSNSYPAFTAALKYSSGLLYCPELMTDRDSEPFYISNEYIKEVNTAIKMFNRDILKVSLYNTDLYLKRLR